jgi:hypothetical protein
MPPTPSIRSSHHGWSCREPRSAEMMLKDAVDDRVGAEEEHECGEAGRRHQQRDDPEDHAGGPAQSDRPPVPSEDQHDNTPCGEA